MKEFCVIPLIAGLMLLLGACQEDFILEANLPDIEEELVVNGVFSPDSLFEVFVNTSKPLLGTEKPEAITNARVEILEGGEVVDVLNYISTHALSGPFIFNTAGQETRTIARYQSTSLFPAIGKNYNIRVIAEGYEEVTGEGHVPPVVPIVDAEYTAQTVIDPILGTRGELRITFVDPPGEANFYNIRHHYRSLDTTNDYVFSYTTGFKLITPLQDDLFGADPDDLVSGNDAFSASEDGVTFSDALFDGKRKEIVIEVADDICGVGTGSPPEFQCQQVVELSTVTEAFYEYHRTLKLQNAAAQNPFAESVRIKSNMSNNLGVFAGINKSIWIHVQQ